MPGYYRDPGNRIKAFTWGLDIAEQMGGGYDGRGTPGSQAGGVGGLLGVHLTWIPRTLAVFHDGNGNVGQGVRVNSGELSAHYEYDPFGNIVRTTDENREDVPFRFSTKHFDHEGDLNLYYYGLRYYSPRLGRWISRDPLGQGGGHNLVAFVLNRPVSLWDVLGAYAFEFLQTAPDYTDPTGSHRGQAGGGWRNFASVVEALRALEKKLSEDGVTDHEGKPCTLRVREDVTLRAFRALLPIEGTGRRVGEGSPDAVMLYGKSAAISDPRSDSIRREIDQNRPSSNTATAFRFRREGSSGRSGYENVLVRDLYDEASLYPDQRDQIKVYLAGCAAHLAPSFFSRIGATDVQPYDPTSSAAGTAAWALRKVGAAFTEKGCCLEGKDITKYLLDEQAKAMAKLLDQDPSLPAYVPPTR